MPLLFYGTRPESADRTPELYGVRLQPIETRVFDSYRVDKLAPYSKRRAVANFWWFTERKHTAFSWHDDRGREQTIWVPGLLNHRDALMLARLEFAEVIPSPIIFRFNNERKVYLYD